jgi:hypothetical protein
MTGRSERFPVFREERSASLAIKSVIACKQTWSGGVCQSDDECDRPMSAARFNSRIAENHSDSRNNTFCAIT